MFSSGNFMVPGHTFKVLIHFQLFFEYKRPVQFDSFTFSCPFSPIPFIEENVFSRLYILASFIID